MTFFLWFNLQCSMFKILLSFSNSFLLNFCIRGSEEKMMELMEEWEQKFCGDVRELIRFLKVVNESFVEQNGHFSRLDFRVS